MRDPPVAHGVDVEDTGVRIQVVVDGDDLTGDGGVDVGRRLHRFDGTHDVADFDEVTDFRQFDEGDVTQGFGGVLGDTDEGGVVVEEGDPLVFGGELDALGTFFGVLVDERLLVELVVDGVEARGGGGN